MRIVAGIRPYVCASLNCADRFIVRTSPFFLSLRYPDRFAIVRHCYTRHQTDRDRPRHSPKRCH
ncbi:hypothetical protein C6P74_17925 [Burkholderia multivorans]|nr:hypothetical protein C6P74_17925 [Burkholderia multivorans]PRE74433.1 hypothetical protein C6Q02_31165 [Burkholderia multivorans]